MLSISLTARYQETRALMSGQECKEALAWILQFHKYCEPSEYPVLRACIFSHHCARICGHIRALVDAGDLEEVLSSSPSILQDVDEVERATHPLSHEEVITDYVVEPPMTPYTPPKHAYPSYVGVHVLQSNFRMRLSYAVFGFLDNACRAPSCTPQQKMVFSRYRRRCIEEIQALSDKVSRISAVLPDIQSCEPVNQGKDATDGLGHNEPQVGGSPDAIKARSKEPHERSTRAVEVCLDFQRPVDGKFTLLFNHTNSGMSVVRFRFGDETRAR